MSPDSRTAVQPRAASKMAGSSASRAPCLVASPARSTWTRSSSERPAAAAAASIFRTSAASSIE